MNKKAFSFPWSPVILLLIIFAVALCLRIIPLYDQVFTDSVVKFIDPDSYFFLHQIDNLSHNFPHLSSFDPYLRYPNGVTLNPLNFFVYLLGGIIWFIDLGSPSVHTVDIISAYFPAIMGALVVLPVYFIGKNLFNRSVGLVAAALIAIMPGEFLGRTLLGRVDRDSVEILLTTTTMLFLILALKRGYEKSITFQHLQPRFLSNTYKPIIYSLLAGILLGFSLFTWRGSFIFIGIILVYLVARFVINYFKNESTDYLTIVSVIIFLVTLVIAGFTFINQLYLTILLISLLIPIALSVLTWLLRRWKIKAVFFPISVIAIGLIGLGIFYAVRPELFQSILSQFRVFFPSETSAIISEMGPILFPSGAFTFDAIWNNFTMGFFLSLVSLIILIYLALKKKDNDRVLIIVWSLVTLIATLLLRRLSIFFSINVALLSGFLVVILYYIIKLIINRVAGKKNKFELSRLFSLENPEALQTPEPSEVSSHFDPYKILGISRDATHKQIKKAHQRLIHHYQTGSIVADGDKEKLRLIEKAYSELSNDRRRAVYDQVQNNAEQKKVRVGQREIKRTFQFARINAAVAGIIVFLLVFIPNIKPIELTIDQTSSYFPSHAWQASLSWIKENTPAPFGDPGYYYEFFEETFQYPDTAYGVAAWWDYGYWVLRIGQRLPVCDPGGGARKLVAGFLAAQNESSADNIIKRLNSKYVILDYDTVIAKANLIAGYAGNNGYFYDIYYVQQGNKMVPVALFYPEYYHSMSVRLYNFNGEEVIPLESKVISYIEKTNADGQMYKEVVTAQSFDSYEKANVFVTNQKSGNYRIVSDDPLSSPVPVEAVNHYKLIRQDDSATLPEFQIASSLSNSVKVFEYIE